MEIYYNVTFTLMYHLFIYICDKVFLKRSLPTYLCVEMPAIVGQFQELFCLFFLNVLTPNSTFL